MRPKDLLYWLLKMLLLELVLGSVVIGVFAQDKKETPKTPTPSAESVAVLQSARLKQQRLAVEWNAMQARAAQMPNEIQRANAAVADAMEAAAKSCGAGYEVVIGTQQDPDVIACQKKPSEVKSNVPAPQPPQPAKDVKK